MGAVHVRSGSSLWFETDAATVENQPLPGNSHSGFWSAQHIRPGPLHKPHEISEGLDATVLCVAKCELPIPVRQAEVRRTEVHFFRLKGQSTTYYYPQNPDYVRVALS